ncbi:hypothetical protein KBTX_02944 [wastewater metagenome]|uniref:Uncharacterized protein n=2 Tax=unclassified sequences TaxID=12908 RepID=A0A5B8RGI1_9ZZZZ|nr:hypothetical protein KBTEX_02944 [uncultured organism]
MDAQPGQGGQPLCGNRGAARAEPGVRVEDGVRVGRGAEAPGQGLRRQPCPAAGRAEVVAAVLREQHADVHAVGTGLEPVEVALDAVPGIRLVPAALAVDDPVAVGLAHLPPGHVRGHAAGAGVAQEVALALGGLAGLPRPYRPLGEAQPVVRYHQGVVDAHDPSEAATLAAGADRGVEREQVGLRVAIGEVAVRAVQGGGETVARGDRAFVVEHVHADPAAAVLQRRFDGLDDTLPAFPAQAYTVLDDVEAAVLGGHPGVTLALEHGPDLIVAEVLGHRDVEADHGALVGGAPEQALGDAARGIPCHPPAAAVAKQRRGAGEQQLEVVVELGHGADGGARRPHRVGLVDGDRRRDALDAVRRGLVHAIEELPCIGREGLDVAALALGVHGVEGEGGLAGPGHAGDHHHLAEGDVEVKVAQVVLPCAADADALVAHSVVSPVRESGFSGRRGRRPVPPPGSGPARRRWRRCRGRRR